MKHAFTFCILLFVFLLLSVDKYYVKAQELKCNSEKPISELLMAGAGETQMIPESGAAITVKQSVDAIDGGYFNIEEVTNVVVVGQDPEEEGVSFTVKVESIQGKIQHDEWFDQEVEKCVGHSPRDPRPANVETCYPYQSVNPPLVYYWETVTEKVCRRIETPAKREIKSVRVWLEPSFETSAWLGWGDMVIDGRASLRYMFPDKWMAGTWTPEGFVTTGTPDVSWNEEYYQKWLAQLQNTNFLAGDTATIPHLWSVTLPEVRSPETETTSLGVLGAFDPGTISDIPSAPVNAYVIDYDTIRNNPSKRRAAYYPASLDPMELTTDSIVFQLVHIPLDLPGIWRIGVQIKMEKAKADDPYGNIMEVPILTNWGAGDTRWFNHDESGYSLENNYFFAYVLVSTPCNPLEDNGCWDGSY